MTESIAEKKQRVLGNAPDGSPAVLRAIRNKEWTAQDAVEYRKYMTGTTGSIKTHAERVALTMRGRK